MHALGVLQEGPNTQLSWILYVLIGLLLLAIVVGAWTSREKKEPAPKPEKPKPEKQVAARSVPARKKASPRKTRKTAAKKKKSK